LVPEDLLAADQERDFVPEDLLAADLERDLDAADLLAAEPERDLEVPEDLLAADLERDLVPEDLARDGVARDPLLDDLARERPEDEEALPGMVSCTRLAMLATRFCASSARFSKSETIDRCCLPTSLRTTLMRFSTSLTVPLNCFCTVLSVSSAWSSASLSRCIAASGPRAELRFACGDTVSPPQWWLQSKLYHSLPALRKERTPAPTTRVYAIPYTHT
jgi:hypothetical protein